jgi:hypothetical protein
MPIKLDPIEFEEISAKAVEAAEQADAEARASRVAAFEQKQIAISEASKIDDIVERAKALADEIHFSDIKKVRQGDLLLATPESTDRNKRNALDMLFGSADAKPHFDEYRGRIVDHDCTPIDEFYPGRKFHDAFDAVGLRKLKESDVLDAVRRWALDHRQNDLTLHVERSIPAWDGEVRMPHALVRMFDCADTDLNRDFGMYFWLSLYMRLTRPGCDAPIVMTLIGVQGCGKSYFGKLLARTLTGNAKSDTVQLDLDANKLEFLRDITGHSVVAAIGEMSGYQRADVNKLKNFITRTEDSMHQKFEGTVQQSRQWVCIADANRYEGLLRDDTGNRRFFPIFCGQIDDGEGGAGWREGFKADFSDFENTLWQLMAEARTWIGVHGFDGYQSMVREVSQQVFKFSQAEAKAGRGVMRDENVLPYIVAALKNASCREIKKRDGSGNAYVFYDRSDLVTAVQAAAAPLDPSREKRFLTDLAKACGMKGGGLPAWRDSKSVSGFAFYDHGSKAELLAAIGGASDGEDVKVIPGEPVKPSGF